MQPAVSRIASSSRQMRIIVYDDIESRRHDRATQQPRKIFEVRLAAALEVSEFSVSALGRPPLAVSSVRTIVHPICHPKIPANHADTVRCWTNGVDTCKS